MFIVTHGDGEKTGWKLGEPKPCGFSIMTVTMMSADGSALQHIRENLKNVPVHVSNNKHTAWYGDMAKFIFANL